MNAESIIVILFISALVAVLWVANKETKGQSTDKFSNPRKPIIKFRPLSLKELEELEESNQIFKRNPFSINLLD